MQQRRGTALQWSTANPVLAAGEIGFETDTSKFKIGNGSSTWSALTYFANAADLAAIVDGAPDLLNTLNELAAAIGDDPLFLTTVATQLSDHSTATTSVHGISNFADLATTSYADTGVSTHNSDSTNVHGIDDTSLLATQSYVTDAIAGVTGDYEDLAGEGLNWNTETEAFDIDSTVATKEYADDAVTTHEEDTVGVHGIADTAALATTSETATAISTAVSDHNSDTTNVHGITNTANLATTSYADTAVSTHSADTTSVHGIADTSLLVTTTGTQTLTNKTLTSPTITIPSSTTNLYGPSTASYGFGANASGSPTFIYASKDILNAISWPVTDAEYVGKTLVISGSSNTSYNGSWVIDSVVVEETQLKFYGSSFATKGHGAIASCTITLQQTIAEKTISTTEIGYIDGVTSAIQTQINGKAATSHSHVISDVTDLQSSLDDKLDLSGGTMTGAITLHADPSSSLHAATKQYVDNTASGIVAKPQVLGATTANIDATYSNGTAGVGATLTHNTNGVFPAEAGGASGWAVGKGILVKNQTNKAQNGRYFISDMGSASTPYVLTRCGYCDEADEIPGAYIFVQDGTSAGTGWIQVVADPATFVVGTDNIDVFQFSGSGTITAGTGISVSGNQVSINTATTVDLSTAQSLSNKTIVAPRVQLTMNAQTGTGYTLAIADASNRWVTMDNSSAITVTVPPSVYSVGDQINVQTIGTGQVTFAQGAGVTITSAAGSSSAPKIRSRYGSATVICVGSNSFTIVGDLI